MALCLEDPTGDTYGQMRMRFTVDYCIVPRELYG